MILDTLPDGVADAVGQISICGRMALAARCFDRVRAHLGVRDPEVEALSDYFWSFTGTDRLDQWEAAFPEGLNSAWGLLEVTGGPTGVHNPAWANEPDPIGQTPPAYLRLPLVLVVMGIIIHDEIGRSNLYSGITGRSESTWMGTVRVLACVRRMGLPLPSLAPFLRSSFAERDGWGESRPREFFAE